MNDKDALAAKVVGLRQQGCVSTDMNGVTGPDVQLALDRAGVPNFGRVNIPIRDRHAFSRYAEMLEGLARDIRAIERSADLSDYEACRDASQRCKSVCRHMLTISKTPQFWAGRK